MGVMSKWLESLDYEYEILDTCTRHLSPHSTCDKCISACQQKALSIGDGKPVLGRGKCIECGNCISACPVQAVAGIYPKRTLIQNQLVIRGKNPPTVKELLILYKKEIKAIICETMASFEGWRQPIDEANKILKSIGEEPFSIEIKSVAEETYVTRRELLFLWKKESKSAVQGIAPAKWRFNYHDMDLSKYYKDVQFARITIDTEKCTLCEICQKLCKKNCFDIQEEQFSLSSKGCENCRLCVDTCPEKAILVEDCISKAEERFLPIYEKRCVNCNKSFKTLREQDKKCVACVKQENLLRKMRRE